MQKMTTEAITTKNPITTIPVLWDGYSVCFRQDGALIPMIIRIITTKEVRIIDHGTNQGHESLFRRQDIFAKRHYLRIYSHKANG